MMACWQIIEFWQGVGTGIAFSFLFWFCLYVTYKAGRESTTKKPEDEIGKKEE